MTTERVDALAEKRKQDMADWIDKQMRRRGLVMASLNLLGIAAHAVAGAPIGIVWLLFLPTLLFGLFANPWWLRRSYRRRHPIVSWVQRQETAS